MRMIGTLKDEDQARRFGDYLYVRGIDNDIEPDGTGWAVWVHSEDHIEEAERLFRQFLEDPDLPEYRKISRAAGGIKKEEQKAARRSRALVIDVRAASYGQSLQSFAPVTMALILISVVVAILSRLGEEPDRLRFLFVTEVYFKDNRVLWIPGLPEIINGEVWRLFSPMFIHFGFIHLLFNMLWLKDLGSMIERRRGAFFMAVFVLIVSTACNLSQYAVSSPLFGGMSGVVYGLFGYIWMKSKFDPRSGMYLHPTTVVMMVAWFFICLAGWVGNIANMAHGVGLGLGMAWGFITSVRLFGGASR